jgi:hypothetical protein
MTEITNGTTGVATNLLIIMNNGINEKFSKLGDGLETAH